MFLPSDLTETEKSLAAQVAREILAEHPNASPSERQQLRHQAEEIAGEMIWASRASSNSSEEESTTSAASDLVAREMAEMEAEIEARQVENERRRRRQGQ